MKAIEIQIFNRDDLHSPQKETTKRPVRETGRAFSVQRVYTSPEQLFFIFSFKAFL